MVLKVTHITKETLSVVAGIIFLLLFPIIAFSQSIDAGKIDSRFLTGIVNIDNLGTGFVVSKMDSASGTRRDFLITNKHMIGQWNMVSEFKYKKDIVIYLYRTDGDKPVVPLGFNIVHDSGNISQFVKLHPNDKIDIAAIEITHLIPAIQKYVNLDYLRIDASYLIPYEKLNKLGFGMGDLVYAIGYPAMIYSKTDNKPIAKVGHISSTTKSDIQLEVPVNIGRKVVKVETEGHIFLVDGLIIGGNSGGPVVCGKGHKYTIDDNGKEVRSAEPYSNLIFGIVSYGIANTGISVIFSSSHIIELIDNF